MTTGRPQLLTLVNFPLQHYSQWDSQYDALLQWHEANDGKRVSCYRRDHQRRGGWCHKQEELFTQTTVVGKAVNQIKNLLAINFPLMYARALSMVLQELRSTSVQLNSGKGDSTCDSSAAAMV